jgi:hypothetical protein
VRRYLSVESNGLLATNVDYDDDNSDKSSFADMLTSDDPVAIPTPVVDNRFANEVLLRSVPPSITVQAPYPAFFIGPPISPEIIQDLPTKVEDPNDPPPGSLEVSIELKVAQNFSDKEFSHHEQSMARLLYHCSPTWCMLSLFHEVLTHQKRCEVRSF